MAALELSMMDAVANGAGALMSKKGVDQFNRTQKKLAREITGELQQDARANLKRLQENLLSIGAGIRQS